MTRWAWSNKHVASKRRFKQGEHPSMFTTQRTFKHKARHEQKQVQFQDHWKSRGAKPWRGYLTNPQQTFFNQIHVNHFFSGWLRKSWWLRSYRSCLGTAHEMYMMLSMSFPCVEAGCVCRSCVIMDFNIHFLLHPPLGNPRSCHGDWRTGQKPSDRIWNLCLTVQVTRHFLQNQFQKRSFLKPWGPTKLQYQNFKSRSMPESMIKLPCVAFML